MVTNDRTLNMKLPEQLYSDLKKTAERKHISLASLVRMLCAEWLEKNGNGTHTADTGARKLTVDEIFNSLPGE